jgi:hypothetical protein
MKNNNFLFRYDNEYGYSNRAVDLIKYIAEKDVREVGTGFEFFTERFVQSHVPRIEYCVPERTR